MLENKPWRDLSFDSFFTHILAHELTHGIGPHTVGTSSSPRKELKELYSAIEEAKGGHVRALYAAVHVRP